MLSDAQKALLRKSIKALDTSPPSMSRYISTGAWPAEMCLKIHKLTQKTNTPIRCFELRPDLFLGTQDLRDLGLALIEDFDGQNLLHISVLNYIENTCGETYLDIKVAIQRTEEGERFFTLREANRNDNS